VETEDFTARCRAAGVPSYQWLVHALCRACMKVEEFRWRLDSNDQPVKVDTLTPSYTVMKKDGNFNFCTVPYQDNFVEYLKTSLATKTRAETSPGLAHDEPGRIDYLFITSIPWMRFTSIQHPVFDIKRVHVPSFAFGKFHVENGRIRFPFSVQGHHGFIDARHMHALEEQLKTELALNPLK
jgi:chloramphenicol O-acetyltransferase